MMRKNGNLVYSTDPNWKKSGQAETEKKDTPVSGSAVISKEKKGRGGKEVTIIRGLTGNLKPLLKALQKFCGSGGTVKNQQIELQGDQRSKAAEYLEKQGIKYKISGKG